MKPIIEKIISELSKNGLDKFKAVNIYDGEKSRQGLLVEHDYCGLYPSDETFEKHHTVLKIAMKYGLKAERRGHYVSTLIYI